jgi:hypothetical protein
MLGLESDALAGRGPALPGLKDIGIREGTFTFLLGVVVADVGCGVVGGGRGDGVGVDTVACEVAGAGDSPGVVGDAEVVCWDCEVAAEDS